MQKSKAVTIQRHIVEQERQFPKATGDFTGLLWDLTIAAKTISREVNKAGLADILGLTGETNIHGDVVKKLDVYANERICKSMEHGGHLCIMASEENEDVIPIPDEFPKGKYVLLFDPLDGSSNIDANVSVGTIFSIHRRKTTGKEATIEDCLRKGTEQVAAGYIIYGSSTMMVYTTGSRASMALPLTQGLESFYFHMKTSKFLPKARYTVLTKEMQIRGTKGQKNILPILKKATPQRDDRIH